MTKDNLKTAAANLVKALDACMPEITATAHLAWVHGQRYSGPTFNEELEALREALNE